QFGRNDHARNDELLRHRRNAIGIDRASGANSSHRRNAGIRALFVASTEKTVLRPEFEIQRFQKRRRLRRWSCELSQDALRRNKFRLGLQSASELQLSMERRLKTS